MSNLQMFFFFYISCILYQFTLDIYFLYVNSNFTYFISMYRFVKLAHFCTYTNMWSQKCEMWSCYGNFTCKQKPDEDSICRKFVKEINQIALERLYFSIIKLSKAIENYLKQP